MQGTKIGASEKRARSPSSGDSDKEVLLSDGEYLDSDYDSWSVHSDNCLQTHKQGTRVQPGSAASSRPTSSSKHSTVSAPVSPTSRPALHKIRSPRREMIDMDGYLRPAENAFEINHNRARCPKCKVFGQFTRDSSAGSRRYKCRTPGCNKTMGCMEFYKRYSTKYNQAQPFISDDDAYEPAVQQESTKEQRGLKVKSQHGEEEDESRKKSSVTMQTPRIGKYQPKAASAPTSAATSEVEGTGIGSSSQVSQKTCEKPSPSTSAQSVLRQWSDAMGHYQQRIVGPAHPANMGISIRRESSNTFRHDATRVESNSSMSLQKRVQLLGIAPHREKAAMMCIESLRPKPVGLPSEMSLVYVSMQYPGVSEIRAKLRSLGFDTDRIYTISKAWDAVEFLVSKEYETEFVNKCKMCTLDIVDKGAMFPRSTSGVAALRKRFGGLIKQNKNPRVQEFFQTRLKELAQWIFDAKLDARAHNEAGNKAIDLQYLNVRAMSDGKFRSILAMIKPASIIFCSETWSVDEETRITHPNVIGCSIPAFRARRFRGRDGIMAFAHTDIMHAIKIIKRTQYTLVVTIDETVVCGVYLPPSLSIETLGKELEKVPVDADIVLGDFNVTFGRAMDKCKAKKERQVILAAFADNRGLTRIHPTSITSKHHGLDHVFAANDRNISNLRLTEAPVNTDHPLLSMQATLTSRLSEDTSSERFWISRLKKEKIASHFCTAFDDMVNGICRAAVQTPPDKAPEMVDIEMLDITLTAVTQYALENTVGCYHPNSSKPQRPTLKAKGHSLADIMRAIKSSKRELGRTTPLRAINPALTAMQEAEQYYTSLFTTVTGSQPPSTTEIETNSMEPKVQDPPPEHPTAVRPIEAHQRERPQPHIAITNEEVKSAIKDYPGDKAPGVDGLDRRVLMCLLESKNFTILLARLFRWCIACQHTPSRWNTSVIHPIPKPGKDADFIANRRPVALTVIFRRIFEKILLPHIAGNESYDKGQGGFRRGFSCITMILLSEQGRKTGLTHRIYLDLESAYDRVNIAKLLQKLAKNNISHKIIALVRSLFTDCSSTIAVNGALSKAIPKAKGLFQGSLLSPALFNWYINDLAETLNSGSEQGLPNAILFADDIMLQTRGVDHGQQMLNQTHAWCIENDMAVNIAKCGTFSIDAAFQINGSKVPVVTTYRYLGIPVGKDGIQVTTLMENHLDKANKAFLFVSRSLCSRSWPETAKLTIFKTFVRSTIEYGAPLVVLLKNEANTRSSKKTFKKGIERLDRLQTECLRWVLAKKRAKKILQAMTATPNIELRFQELTARLRIHLRAMHPAHELRFWKDHPEACRLVQAAYTYPVAGTITATNISNHYRTQFLGKCKASSRLAALIDDSCRTDIGIDACLEIPDYKVRALAIAWRTNTFGLRATCNKCSCPFNRKHVNTCFTSSITGKLALSFERSKNAPLTFGREYTILDHLLNARRHDLFYREICQLQALMASHIDIALRGRRGDGIEYPSSDLQSDD